MPEIDKPDLRSNKEHRTQIIQGQVDKKLGSDFMKMDVLGMSRRLDAVFAEVSENNPKLDILSLYRLFTERMPYFIPSEVTNKAIEAISNQNPDINRAGTNVLVLTHMKTILSAAQPFLSENPDSDTDLVQAGITKLITDAKKTPLCSGAASVHTRLNGIIQEGIAQEIAHRDGVSARWAKQGVDTKITSIVEKLLNHYPLGMSESEMKVWAGKISAETDIPERSVHAFIQQRTMLMQTDVIIDDEDLADQAIRPDIKEMLQRYIDRLTFRLAKVVRARFGLLEDDPHEYTVEEIAKLLDISESRVSQLETKGLRKLNRFIYTSKLALSYIYPECYLPVAPAEGTVDTWSIRPRNYGLRPDRSTDYSALLDTYIDELRLKYRYSWMWIGLNPLMLWGYTQIPQQVAEKLQYENITTIAELLGKKDQELLNTGITRTELSSIKTTMRKFLEEDAKQVTIGDTMIYRPTTGLESFIDSLRELEATKEQQIPPIKALICRMWNILTEAQRKTLKVDLSEAESKELDANIT